MRSSLQFSNTSCEQLEQKIEELEHNNERLQKLCNIQQSLLAQKTSALVDVQKDFTRLKCQHEQLLQVKVAIEETNTSYQAEQMLHSKNMTSEVGNEHLHTNDSSDVTKLQSSLAELAQNVQNLTLQKQKAENQLEEIMNENQSLVKGLERADDEIVDLQTRLRSYEEKTLDLKSKGSPFSDIPQFSPCDNIQSPLALQPTCKACKSPNKCSSNQDTGLSLFCELDVQYSTLQQRYCDLVEQCTCSASLFHKKCLPSEKSSANSPENSMVTDAPFKELFDEVFASLKQTTLVADKLIEKKK